MYTHVYILERIVHTFGDQSHIETLKMGCCPAQHPYMKVHIALLHHLMLTYSPAPFHKAQRPEVAVGLYLLCHIYCSGFLESPVEKNRVCVWDRHWLISDVYHDTQDNMVFNIYIFNLSSGLSQGLGNRWRGWICSPARLEVVWQLWRCVTSLPEWHSCHPSRILCSVCTETLSCLQLSAPLGPGAARFRLTWSSPEELPSPWAPPWLDGDFLRDAQKFETHLSQSSSLSSLRGQNMWMSPDGSLCLLLFSLPSLSPL